MESFRGFAYCFIDVKCFLLRLEAVQHCRSGSGEDELELLLSDGVVDGFPFDGYATIHHY